MEENIVETIDIEKEDIKGCAFPKEDVLSSPEKIQERDSRIIKAIKLGNALKGKVKILFESNNKIYRVETTLWGATEKNIILKKTTLIPIKAIHEIKFY